jgi:uncharacterized protein
MDEQLQIKLSLLESWFAARKGSIVAFSGGIDSSLVLFLARKYQGREQAVGVISNSESLKERDFEEAKQFCAKFDIHLETIHSQEITDERYSRNPENRCYFCKMHLFDLLRKMKESYPEYDILSGTNIDDLGDYRPGLQAASEQEVQAPLSACGITKSDIRQLALHFGLPNHDKPASPCLSSRIPYNQEITKEKLRQVEAAENYIYDLGFSDVRVRHYASQAKVEVPANEVAKLLSIKDKVESKLKNIGFKDIIIDEEGLVSGKLNRVIKTAAI